MTIYNKCIDEGYLYIFYYYYFKNEGDQSDSNPIKYYDSIHAVSGEMVINAATVTKKSIDSDILDSVSFLVYMESDG